LYRFSVSGTAAGRALLLAGTCLVGGCTFLPTSGPYSPAINDGSASQSPESEKLQYALINLSGPIVDKLSAQGGTQFSGVFTDRRPYTEVRFGVGDIAGVTIFEAAAGGLFIPSEAGSRAGNFVQLPDQQVDRQGNVSVPYAGLVPAAGRTTAQVQRDIEERLRRRAIEPQAVVVLKEQRSQRYSVLGDVNAPLQLPINPSGERILDAIARAGGPSGPGYESFVTLQRGRQKATINFNRLVNEPANNIYVQPGDTIYVSRESRYYVALGASGQQGLIKFEAETLTLSSAVGKAGGLLDERADPASLFVYRQESIGFLRDIGVDVTPWQGQKQVPVIYNVNLREPAGYFLAAKFWMRDKDVIFTANAGSVEYSKFLELLRLQVAAVREGNALRTEIKN